MNISIHSLVYSPGWTFWKHLLQWLYLQPRQNPVCRSVTAQLSELALTWCFSQFLMSWQVSPWTYRALMCAPCSLRTWIISSDTRAPSPLHPAMRASSGLCLTHPSLFHTTRYTAQEGFIQNNKKKCSLKFKYSVRWKCSYLVQILFVFRSGSWRVLWWTLKIRPCGTTTA